MATPIGFSAKFAPDPKRPGSFIVTGSYAHDFLAWAKRFGSPSWSERGDQGIMGRDVWIQEPIFEMQDDPKEPDGKVSVCIQKGIRVKLFYPLSVLEPLYESMLKRESFCYLNMHGDMICKAP